MRDGKVTSTLQGSKVILKITCLNDYEAMALHDSIIKAAELGAVTLKIDGVIASQTQRSEAN